MAIFLQFWLHGYSFAETDVSFRKGYWLDESRTARLSEAKEASYTKFEGSISKGYSPHSLWIKLPITGQSDSGDWAIVVRPTFLSHIELHDPDLLGPNAPPVISGRDAPIKNTNHVGFDNGFIIQSTPETRDVYIRITTTTSLTADVSIQPVAVATKNSFVTSGLVAGYFAFLLAFCVWSLVAWGIRRDALYGLFALRQFYSLAHMFVFFGSLRFCLTGNFGAEARELIYAVVSCTVASVVGYFDVRLIAEFGGSRWLRRAIYVLLCLPVVTLTFVALGHVQTALQITAILVNIQMFAMVAFAFTITAKSTRRFAKTSVLLVRSGYVIMMAVVAVPLLMYQNLLHTNVPLFKILFLHAVISTIILFAILSIRSRQRDLMAQEAWLMVGLKNVELRAESSRRIEKERFLSMLTHELRNPLSVIELLPGTDPASAATVRDAARDMAEVIDRVEQSERIDSGRMQVEMTTFDLTSIVRQVVQKHRACDRLVVDCISPQMVQSDSILFHLIVQNLLDNAAKYSVPGSIIRIMLADQAEGGAQGVLLSVKNEIGNAGPPDPTRLFTKYYRAKGAHRQPGSGLGLFLVASWVSALGGTVAYAQGSESDDLRRAIFKVWMPR